MKAKNWHKNAQTRLLIPITIENDRNLVKQQILRVLHLLSHIESEKEVAIQLDKEKIIIHTEQIWIMLNNKRPEDAQP